MEEVHVVTFLHFHFANRKPHNIFTILLDVPLWPKLCLKNSPEDWRLLRCGLEVESGDEPGSLGTLTWHSAEQVHGVRPDCVVYI